MSILSDKSGLIGACVSDEVSPEAGRSYLTSSEYGSGSAVYIPLSEDGLFKRDASGEVLVSTYHLPRDATPRPHGRQDAPHAHQIVIHGDEVIVPDLGSNAVWRLHVVDGKWKNRGSIPAYEEGDGPRHVAIHPDGTSQPQS